MFNELSHEKKHHVRKLRKSRCWTASKSQVIHVKVEASEPFFFTVLLIAHDTCVRMVASSLKIGNAFDVTTQSIFHSSFLARQFGRR